MRISDWSSDVCSSDLLCLALSDVALAEDHAKHFSEAEAWRHRQIEACTRAGDPIFIANGKYGVGKMAAAQGHHAEALKWGREALAEFEAVGFAVGSYRARLVIAESLIEVGRASGREGESRIVELSGVAVQFKKNKQ